MGIPKVWKLSARAVLCFFCGILFYQRVSYLKTSVVVFNSFGTLKLEICWIFVTQNFKINVPCPSTILKLQINRRNIVRIVKKGLNIFRKEWCRNAFELCCLRFRMNDIFLVKVGARVHFLFLICFFPFGCWRGKTSFFAPPPKK
jgi:hypothetical protein